MKVGVSNKAMNSHVFLEKIKQEALRKESFIEISFHKVLPRQE
jgi:hypothetical protein